MAQETLRIKAHFLVLFTGRLGDVLHLPAKAWLPARHHPPPSPYYLDTQQTQGTVAEQPLTHTDPAHRCVLGPPPLALPFMLLKRTGTWKTGPNMEFSELVMKGELEMEESW